MSEAQTSMSERAQRRTVLDEIHARNRHLDPEEVERDVAEAIEELRTEDRAFLDRYVAAFEDASDDQLEVAVLAAVRAARARLRNNGSAVNGV